MSMIGVSFLDACRHDHWSRDKSYSLALFFAHTYLISTSTMVPAHLHAVINMARAVSTCTRSL